MDAARPRFITAGRIITPSGDLTPGSVEIDGGRIVSVRAGAAPGADLSATDGVLAPGFIDLQINGAAGGGFFSPLTGGAGGRGGRGFAAPGGKGVFSPPVPPPPTRPWRARPAFPGPPCRSPAPPT